MISLSTKIVGDVKVLHTQPLCNRSCLTSSNGNPIPNRNSLHFMSHNIIVKKSKGTLLTESPREPTVQILSMQPIYLFIDNTQ